MEAYAELVRKKRGNSLSLSLSPRQSFLVISQVSYQTSPSPRPSFYAELFPFQRESVFRSNSYESLRIPRNNLPSITKPGQAAGIS